VSLNTILAAFRPIAPGQATAGSLDQLTALYILILLLALGSAAWVLVRRRQTRQLLVQRLRELGTLAEIGQSIARAELDLEQLAQVVYQQAGKIVDTQYFQLGLFEGERYRPLIWIENGQLRPPAEFQSSAGDDALIQLLRTRRQSLLVRDFERESDALPASRPDRTAGMPRSGIFVPLLLGDQLLGAIVIHGRQPNAVSEEHDRLLSIVGNQAAAALQNARLYEQASARAAAEQRRADQLAALAQVSRTVTTTLDLDELLDEVLDVVNERFGYKCARIFLADEDRLIYRAGIGEGTVGNAIQGLTYRLDGPGIIPLVGRTRQAVRLDDVTQNADYVPGPGLASTRSEMAAPMAMGERLLGVFDVQADIPASFSDEDARTLQAVADTVAVAVRNARLFEFERRRRRLAEIMRQVSGALTSTLQLDRVLDLILDGLALVVSYDAASILLVNDAAEMILQAGRGAPGIENAIGRPLEIKRFGPGETAPAVLSFGDVDVQHQYHDLLHLPEPHACLAVALVPGGDHLGYLVVDHGNQTHFPQGEVELVTTFASQAAVAIDNARRYTAQREQAWISTALLQVAEATAHAAELTEVLDTVARLTPMLVGVDRCAIILADADKWRLAAYAGAGEDLAAAELEERLPEENVDAGWSGFQRLLTTRQPVVLTSDDDMPASLRAQFEGVVILLPLLAHGEVVGVMVVGEQAGETPFTPHRIQLLGGIANQAALAVEGALLSVSQQEEAWVSTALLQVAESVAGQLLDTSLETVARLTPILVGIEKIGIYQYDALARAFRLRQVTGLDRSAALALADRLIALNDLGLAPEAELLNSAAPWHITLPDWLAQLFGRPDCYVWPLRARGDVLGALVTEALPLLGRRLTILNGIAYQLAMAMENSRLTREVAQQERLERELEVGRDIQASFLPQSYPQADGWELHAFWRAARQVGGDFYDFIELAPGENGPRWGIVIADVADKGVPAALFMALSRTLLRTVAIARVKPGATLSRVNDLILADARSQQFVTVCYGVLEPAIGLFRYAIGGHNPPIMVRGDGTAATIAGRGIALGVMDAMQYTEHEVQLHSGDSLVLYTDGLTEAINARDEEFGLKRVLDSVRDQYATSAAAMVEGLAAAVETHASGVEVFDDLTLVVIKRVGLEQNS
jgi:serine phosphatase RsbU (regulator of sigma subunit)/transcriptional regulator with GAF, ATPase, and Fis domain